MTQFQKAETYLACKFRKHIIQFIQIARRILYKQESPLNAFFC